MKTTSLQSELNDLRACIVEAAEDVITCIEESRGPLVSQESCNRWLVAAAEYRQWTDRLEGQLSNTEGNRFLSANKAALDAIEDCINGQRGRRVRYEIVTNTLWFLGNEEGDFSAERLFNDPALPSELRGYLEEMANLQPVLN